MCPSSLFGFLGCVIAVVLFWVLCPNSFLWLARLKGKRVSGEKKTKVENSEEVVKPLIACAVFFFLLQVFQSINRNKFGSSSLFLLCLVSLTVSYCAGLIWELLSGFPVGLSSILVFNGLNLPVAQVSGTRSYGREESAS